MPLNSLLNANGPSRDFVSSWKQHGRSGAWYVMFWGRFSTSCHAGVSALCSFQDSLTPWNAESVFPSRWRERFHRGRSGSWTTTWRKPPQCSWRANGESVFSSAHRHPNWVSIRRARVYQGTRKLNFFLSRLAEEVFPKVEVTQMAVINEVTPEHLDNTYTCIATNAIGTDKVTIRLKQRHTGSILFLLSFTNLGGHFHTVQNGMSV